MQFNIDFLKMQADVLEYVQKEGYKDNKKPFQFKYITNNNFSYKDSYFRYLFKINLDIKNPRKTKKRILKNITEILKNNINKYEKFIFIQPEIFGYKLKYLNVIGFYKKKYLSIEDYNKDLKGENY